MSKWLFNRSCVIVLIFCCIFNATLAFSEDLLDPPIIQLEYSETTYTCLPESAFEISDLRIEGGDNIPQDNLPEKNSSWGCIKCCNGGPGDCGSCDCSPGDLGDDDIPVGPPPGG